MDAPGRPTLLENLRALPSSAWVLFGGVFVTRVGTFVLPFFTLYLTRRGYSAPQAGFAIGAYGLGALVAQLIGGLLADRIGRRNAIGLSMCGAGAVTLALWRADSLALIYPLMFALACIGEVHRPASGALIADLVPSERRVSAFTMFRLAINVGWAVGLALGGFLAERSFDLLFVGDAATSVAFGIISLVALPHGVRSARHQEVDLPTARAAIRADRGFLLFLASALLSGAVYAQNVSSLPLHVREAGFGPSTYGTLQSLNGVIVVLIELPVIAWTQRHGRLSMVALGQLLIGLGFASLLFADTIPLLVVMVVVWTLGEICGSSAATAIAADRAPEHARGRFQSALGAAWSVAFMLGPVLGTLVYGRSRAALWWACGGLGVVSSALALTARRFPAPAPGRLAPAPPGEVDVSPM
jgi:MFS family permease